MSSSIPLLVSAVSLFIVTGLVAIRLLWLAWRTGEVPERLMGLGLTGILVYMPIMATTGMGRVTVGELNLPLLIAAFPLFAGGFACTVCFTWRVFRPSSAWAMVFAFGLTLVGAALLGAMIGALHASPPERASFEAGQLWSGLLRLPMTVGFAWTGLEGAIAWSKARRRMQLGLADPVVANRFLLWAVVGATQVVIQAVSAVLHFQGQGMMASSTGLFVTSVGASVGGLALFLVFLPPKAYVRFIARRAGVVAG